MVCVEHLILNRWLSQSVHLDCIPSVFFFILPLPLFLLLVILLFLFFLFFSFFVLFICLLFFLKWVVQAPCNKHRNCVSVLCGKKNHSSVHPPPIPLPPPPAPSLLGNRQYLLDSIVCLQEMTLWGNRERAVWTRIAKDRERWRTLAEGYFLQWNDTA